MASKRSKNVQTLPAKGGDPVSSDPSPESAELLNKFKKSLNLKQDRQRKNHGYHARQKAEAGMESSHDTGRSVQSGLRNLSSRNGRIDGTRNIVAKATQSNDTYPIPTQAYTTQNEQYTPNQQPLTQQQQTVYPTPNVSPYWPYGAPPLPYNSINYYMPQMSQPTYWQYPQPRQSQAPFPQPSSSGTVYLTASSPPFKNPPEEVNPLAHIPEPTQDYILSTSLPPYRLETPNTKLLILDLNGTLLYRRRHSGRDRNMDMRRSSQKPLLRPHLAEFMDYIFRHFKIMFWSSATPRNVHAMISAATTDSQRTQIVTIWDRQSLGLSSSAYRSKSITFKDLNKVFTDESLRVDGAWDISNTILLDDSVIKASNQPYNHVCVPEFLVEREHWEKEAEGVGGWKDDVLWQVAGYLDELRYQGHVARFIKQSPFRVGDGWDGKCLNLG